MPIVAADLGGTKLATGLFSDSIGLVKKEKFLLEKREGDAVGQLIRDRLTDLIRDVESRHEKVDAIGISVPGIYHASEGAVWAPNIPGWENYPLLKLLQQISHGIPVVIQSDRACYITAEVESGLAKGCTDAVFIAVGTGIGAGIIAGGRLLTGANDIAGAIGWMALERPYHPRYDVCGCFESSASGTGMAKMAVAMMQDQSDYTGVLLSFVPGELSAHDIFTAFENNDPIATEVVSHSIEMWGMALANVVSMLNPQIVIFGGGVFGPAARWLPDIIREAKQWAQPISMQHVSVAASSFGPDAGLIGAACLAYQTLNQKT